MRVLVSFPPIKDIHNFYSLYLFSLIYFCLCWIAAPRSGLAWKHSIDVGAGVIDADYRGPVGVILFNHSDVDFEVKVGDRVAQLIIEKIVTPSVTEVDDLDETVRGEGGFGSTGVWFVLFCSVGYFVEQLVGCKRIKPLFWYYLWYYQTLYVNDASCLPIYGFIKEV